MRLSDAGLRRRDKLIYLDHLPSQRLKQQNMRHPRTRSNRLDWSRAVPYLQCCHPFLKQEAPVGTHKVWSIFFRHQAAASG